MSQTNRQRIVSPGCVVGLGVIVPGGCQNLDFDADSDCDSEMDLEDFAGFARVFGRWSGVGDPHRS